MANRKATFAKRQRETDLKRSREQTEDRRSQKRGDGRDAQRARDRWDDYGDTVAQELLARGSRRDRGGVRCSTAACAPRAHRALPAPRLLASPLGPLVARCASAAARSPAAHASDLGHAPAARSREPARDVASCRAATRRCSRRCRKLLGYIGERAGDRARAGSARSATRAAAAPAIDRHVDPVLGRRRGRRAIASSCAAPDHRRARERPATAAVSSRAVKVRRSPRRDRPSARRTS